MVNNEIKSTLLGAFKTRIFSETGQTPKLAEVLIENNDMNIFITIGNNEPIKTAIEGSNKILIKTILLRAYKKEVKKINPDFDRFNWIILQLNFETDEINVYSEYTTDLNEVLTHKSN